MWGVGDTTICNKVSLVTCGRSVILSWYSGLKVALNIITIKHTVYRKSRSNASWCNVTNIWCSCQNLLADTYPNEPKDDHRYLSAAFVLFPQHLFSYWKLVSFSADVLYFGAPVLILEVCIVFSWCLFRGTCSYTGSLYRCQPICCILEHLFWYWKPVSFSADDLYFGALVLILEALSFSADFFLYFGAPVLILEALSFSADFVIFRSTCSHTGGFVIFIWFCFYFRAPVLILEACIVFSWFFSEHQFSYWSLYRFQVYFF